MKRFHGKFLNPPSAYIPNTLQKILVGKVYCWIYTEVDLSVYDKLVLSKIETIDMPLLDVYEINVEVMNGITIGYMFDTTARKITSSFNYILLHSLLKDEFSLTSLKEMEVALELRFKIKNINLYSLGVKGSLITLGFSDNVREVLEFN